MCRGYLGYGWHAVGAKWVVCADRFRIASRRLSAEQAWSAWCTTVSVTYPRILSDSVNLDIPLLERDTVDVHGPIAALGGDVFVQRVPSNPLHIMIVFRYLMDTFACKV